jgi:hypothetical protein
LKVIDPKSAHKAAIEIFLNSIFSNSRHLEWKAGLSEHNLNKGQVHPIQQIIGRECYMCKTSSKNIILSMEKLQSTMSKLDEK